MKAEDPSTLVQRQLDACNAKDVEAWLSTYAPEAEQFKLHGERLAQGRDGLRRRIVQRFEEPDLHARLGGLQGCFSRVSPHQGRKLGGFAGFDAQRCWHLAHHGCGRQTVCGQRALGASAESAFRSRGRLDLRRHAPRKTSLAQDQGLCGLLGRGVC